MTQESKLINDVARAIYNCNFHPKDVEEKNPRIEELWELEKDKAIKQAKAAISVIEKRKSLTLDISEKWCLEMAQKEDDSDCIAGVPDNTIIK